MAPSRLTGALKAWLPPALLQWRRRYLKSGVRYEGSYASWQEALRRSIGYDSPVILERVSAALLKVKALAGVKGIDYEELCKSLRYAIGLKQP